jgi:hypothetical protein
VFFATAVQASVGPDVLARVAAIDLLGSEGGQPAGYALAGPAAAAVGAHTFLTASAVVMAVAGGRVHLRPRAAGRRERRPARGRVVKPGFISNGGARTGGEGGYHAPFGQKRVYFISGVPSGSGLPPVPAADALKNR